MSAQTASGTNSNLARPVVVLPAHSHPHREQKVIGIVSRIEPSVQEFRGIPYAVVPGRWQHSMLRDDLPNDDFDASQFGPRCVQPHVPDTMGEQWGATLIWPKVEESEFDCCNLFIVRPSPGALEEIGIPASTRLPVYIFVHGGGFFLCANSDPIWTPTHLVAQSSKIKKPIIAVYPNYRLGLFGAMASTTILEHQKEGFRGCNFGIHDQHLALKWIARNISAFGGDPDRMTIHGHSAGACHVDLHFTEATMTRHKPLVQRGIVSSSALNAWVLSAKSMSVCDSRWDLLCKHLKISDLSAGEQLEHVIEMPAQDLLGAGMQLSWLYQSLAIDNITIRKKEDGHLWFDFEQSEEGLAPEGSLAREPMEVLIGDSADEGEFVYAMAGNKVDKYDKIHQLFLDHFGSESLVGEVVKIYKISAGADAEQIKQSMNTLCTDFTFGWPDVQSYRRFLSGSDQAIRAVTPHRYRINFGIPFDCVRKGMSVHTIEAVYLWDAFHDQLRAKEEDEKIRPEEGTNATHLELKNTMQKVWIDFIYGDFHLKKNEAIMFHKDRTTGVVDMETDPEWIDIRARLDFIGRHFDEVTNLCTAIVEMGGISIYPRIPPHGGA